MPEPRVEPTPRWVRVRAGQEVIADSRDALLLSWYGPGMLPTYCFPEAHVRTDVLVTQTPVVVDEADRVLTAGLAFGVDHQRRRLVPDEVLEPVAEFLELA